MPAPCNIISVPIKDFYNTYLGGWARIGEKEMDKVQQHLRQGMFYHDGHWSGFPGAKAHPPTEHRQAIWTPIQHTFAIVASAAATLLGGLFSLEKQRSTFQCGYDSQTFPGDEKVEPASVDGWSTLEDKSVHGTRPGSAYDTRIMNPSDAYAPRVWAADVGITARWERRGNTKGRRANERGTIAAASHVLANDRRRAFHIAITLEDTLARLWYHSRSHSVVSAPFDVNEDPAEFIQFILFATYATPAQLGLDPCIARVVDARRRLQYQFSIQPDPASDRRVVYQTTGVIAQRAPTGDLHAGETVVFRVQGARQWGDGMSAIGRGAERVLKDFAAPVSARREVDLQRAVQEALRKTARTEGEWHVMNEGFVRIMADMPAALNVQIAVPAGEQLGFEPRRRHLTVYKDVCVDLYTLDDPGMYYHALSRVSRILLNMKRVGAVHRDPSPGNFLVKLPEGNGSLDDCVVKMTDLETMRFYEELEPWGWHTGTDFYMAVEAQAGRYLFFPDDAPPELLSRYYFVHNPYHDLESALWMAIDYALQYADTEVVRAAPEGSLNASLRHQRDYHGLVFVGHTGSETRLRLMQGDEAECEMLRTTLARAYGADSPMPTIVDLIYAMGRAHREAQGEDMKEEVAAGVPPEAVAYKRLPLYHFHSDVYRMMEKGFGAISKYYEGAGRSLVLLEDMNLEAQVGGESEVVKEVEPVEQAVREAEVAVSKPEATADDEKTPEVLPQSDAVSEIEALGVDLETASVSSAIKRKANDAPEEPLHAKRPCSALQKIRMYGAPGENMMAKTPKSKSVVGNKQKTRVKADVRPPWR